MERFLEQYDKECMKMAILKHEQTFRQQVHELHRLYRVQKILMNDMKNMEMKSWLAENDTASLQPHFSYRDQSRPLDLDLPAEKYIAENDSDGEGELELTLAIGRRSKNKKKNKEESLSSGASFSSSSPESSGVKLNGNEWIHFRSDRRNGYNVEEQIRQDRRNGYNVEEQIRQDRRNGYNVEEQIRQDRRNGYNVEEQIRQDRMKHPPWLLQCLSLNMT